MAVTTPVRIRVRTLFSDFVSLLSVETVGGICFDSERQTVDVATVERATDIVALSNWKRYHELQSAKCSVAAWERSEGIQSR